MDENKYYWHNYDTGECDLAEFPQTYDEAMCRVPNHPSARQMLRCHKKMGTPLNEAMKDVLTACLPKEYRE